MRKTKKENAAIEREHVNHEYNVRRAFEFKNGDVVFDLDIDDMTIYGCRVVEGKDGDFISMPRKKGSDGKYYSIVYRRFTDEETNEILDKVSAKLADM